MKILFRSHHGKTAADRAMETPKFQRFAVLMPLAVSNFYSSEDGLKYP